MMDAEKNTCPISRMAELLGVDRRRYYDWVAARGGGAGPTFRFKFHKRLLHFEAFWGGF